MTREPACPSCLLYRSCVYPYLFETPPEPRRRQVAQVPRRPAPVRAAAGVGRRPRGRRAGQRGRHPVRPRQPASALRAARPRSGGPARRRPGRWSAGTDPGHAADAGRGLALDLSPWRSAATGAARGSRTAALPGAAGAGFGNAAAAAAGREDCWGRTPFNSARCFPTCCGGFRC